MKAGVIGFAMLSMAQVTVTHVALAAVHAPLRPQRALAEGEGADSGRGTAVAGRAASSFLAPAETRESPLMAVSEGGEGGRGRGRWRRGYAYPAPYYYYAPPPRVYAPPPVYYAPPPVYYAPRPRVYAPPPVYYAPPPTYYVPRPGLTLFFGF